ncbi:PmeII family type II restriction endonuclease [Candidatus Riflebacteria bacterium]
MPKPGFIRSSLRPDLPPEIFKKIVKATKELLERRYKFLAKDFNDISKTNFNPLLLLITAPAYNLYSPFEVAERLQLGKAFHGDDTAFGRFAEEKILSLFNIVPPQEKKKGPSKSLWSPIDVELTIEGTRYLMSIKAGPWTMNQSHANEMINNFLNIHKSTNAKILIGILYGNRPQLNNKPALVARSLGSPAWLDYLVGREFWEFVTGVKDVHEKIFRAIRKAQKEFAKLHADETFHEQLVANRLKIAASLRKQFKVDNDKDFWWTLFNKAF